MSLPAGGGMSKQLEAAPGLLVQGLKEAGWFMGEWLFLAGSAGEHSSPGQPRLGLEPPSQAPRGRWAVTWPELGFWSPGLKLQPCGFPVVGRQFLSQSHKVVKNHKGTRGRP